jgi:glycosyltransferase involved in cell wall biosynthesis
MSRSVELSLILPCYNEAGLFTDSVARIVRVLELTKISYEIIFVDDASRDATPQLIEKLVKKQGKQALFRAIYHATNLGRGKTVTDGIRAAKGAVVGYIDIDCEVDPVYIPGMTEMIRSNEADVVIGKRFYRTSPRAIIREVLSRGYQWLSDCLIGTGRMDTETGYKFFSRKKILPVLSQATHPGWFWDTEIMVYAKRAKLRIIEVPVLFLRRFDKQSSVNIVRDTLDYMKELLLFRQRLRKNV